MITRVEFIFLLILVGIFIVIFLLILGAKIASKRKYSETKLKLENKDKSKSEEIVSNIPFQSKKLLQNSLQKTRNIWLQLIDKLSQGDQGNSSYFEEIEELLYLSDLGTAQVTKILNQLKSLNYEEKHDPNRLREVLQKELKNTLLKVPSLDQLSAFNFANKPEVILIVGVNGVGKTTTVGKIAYQAAQKGLSVLVAAGDTFRAAASEQLAYWVQRAKVELFAPEGVKDPAAVAFQAIQKGQQGCFDLILIDTAGRLHTSNNLMEELKKIYRVIQKLNPQLPHHIFLVIDATGGQNALVQVRSFQKVIPLTGIILTKLDSTSKGGMAVSIVEEIKLPIVWLGIGEKSDDLIPFVAEDFVETMLN